MTHFINSTTAMVEARYAAYFVHFRITLNKGLGNNLKVSYGQILLISKSFPCSLGIEKFLGVEGWICACLLWPYYSNSSETPPSAKDLKNDSRHQEDNFHLP